MTIFKRGRPRFIVFVFVLSSVFVVACSGKSPLNPSGNDTASSVTRTPVPLGSWHIRSRRKSLTALMTPS